MLEKGKYQFSEGQIQFPIKEGVHEAINIPGTLPQLEDQTASIILELEQRIKLIHFLSLLFYFETKRVCVRVAVVV